MTATTTGAAIIMDNTAVGYSTYADFGGSATNSGKPSAVPSMQAVALDMGETYGLAIVLVGFGGGLHTHCDRQTSAFMCYSSATVTTFFSLFPYKGCHSGFMEMQS